MAEERFVVVTTEFRGVFAGVLAERKDREVTLADARHCVSWPATVKGFMGLAATGPLDGSRIGPKVPKIELVGVTSISDCTAEAREKWEASPWPS